MKESIIVEGYTAGQIRKTLVSIISFCLVGLSVCLAQGDMIPESWMKWAVLLIALGNAYGVFKVRNDPS